MSTMMSGVLNYSLRHAGLKNAEARPLGPDFVMTERERAAARADISALMSESAAVRNTAAERAGRIATDRF